jgi:xanthine dehydrogenase accessory factor
MSSEVFVQLRQYLTTQPVVLATIVQTQGSTPREVGAKMLIGSEGRLFGTIGGGAGEALVIETGLQVLVSGLKQVVKIDLSGIGDRETQGVCGGQMVVWLERWELGQIEFIETILSTLKIGRSIQLITPWNQTDLPYLSDNRAVDPINAWCEILNPKPQLLIVGAGHCGIQLAQVAHIAGFEIVICDDRTEWANAEHFPQAQMIVTKPFPELLQDLSHHQQLYVALVTRSYQHDVNALVALMQASIAYKYIGMIGSRKRIQQVYQAVKQITAVSDAELERIYAPIGLAIGALTPGEIAISIIAQLIAVRRGGGN